MKPHLNVIVLEDNPLDARLVVRELERGGFRVNASVVDSEEAFRLALDSPHDVILVDYTLPSYDAMQALHEVQRRALDIPVLLVTGTVDEQRALACLRAGYDDYLIKDRLARLGMAVEQALERRSQQQKMRTLRDRQEAGERRLSALLDAGQEACVLLDASGHILFSAGARRLGYRHEEAVGLTLVDVVHPDQFEEVVQAVAALVERGPGSEHRGEYLGRAKDGTYRCLGIFAINRLDDPDVGGIVVNLRDITEEKAARLALEESEQRYRSLFEATRSIICTHTLGGTIVDVNGAVQTAIGLRPEEMIGRTLSDYFAPCSGGLAVHRSREGTSRWMLAESHASAHAGGAPLVTTHYTDVTEQLEARDELRRQTELLRTIVDTIVTYMRTSELAEACRVVVRGLTQLEDGLRGGLLIRGDERWETIGDAALCSIEGVLALAGSRAAGAPMVTMDGRSILPVVVADEEVAWFVIDGPCKLSLEGLAQTVGLLYDADRRKRQEERLQIELRQSQKLEAVGRLVGGIAHDFNNLLTAIMGFVERARETIGADHAAADDLEQVQQSAMRAERLTRQLLSFSRRQPTAPSVLELQATMHDLGHIFDRILGEDIEVRLALNDKPVLVAGTVEQLVVGLVVRARDALPRGGRLMLATSEIELRSSDARRSGTFAVLSIHCEGPEGADMRNFGGLFEGASTGGDMSRPAGHALCLLVDQAGGWLDVDPLGTEASTVRIYLPRCDPSASEVPKVLAKGHPRALLVEDEDMVRRLVRLMLEDAGFEVLDTSSGADAVRLMEAQAAPLDLLITDVVMPGMNGRELASALAEKHPALKVIFISGYTEDAIVRNGVQNEDLSFLQKPFTRKRFLHKVGEVMAAP